MSTLGQDPASFIAWLRGLDDDELDAYGAEVALFADDDSRLGAFSRLTVDLIAQIRVQRAGRAVVHEICAAEFPDFDADVMTDAVLAINRGRRQLGLKANALEILDGALEVAERQQKGPRNT